MSYFKIAGWSVLFIPYRKFKVYSAIPGYLRSTLAELAINESVDESQATESAQLAEQRTGAKREKERTCHSGKRQVKLSRDQRFVSSGKRD